MGKTLLGFLGGSFDPIHCGHLALAQHAIQTLGLSALYLLPVGNPPHRSPPHAAFVHRVAMINLALAESPLHGVALSLSDQPRADRVANYSIDLIKKLRAQYPQASLIWIIGADVFNQFDRWRNWQLIPDYVHLAVGTRGGETIFRPHASASLQNLWDSAAHDPAVLSTQNQGAIIPLSFPALPFSSSAIRLALSQQDEATSDRPQDFCQSIGLSYSVYCYIRSQSLYQPS